MLARAAGAAAACIVAPRLHAMDALAASPALIKTELSPTAALEELIRGNARFVAGKPLAPHRDFARIREIAPKQAPFAAILGCADSRVPLEILFDQGFGDIFPVRVAGNIVSPEVVASLEYGAAVLGASVLMVLGHTSCGAVAATIKGEAEPGQITSLYQHIAPAVEFAKGDMNVAVEENVRIQARLLARSPLLTELRDHSKLLITGAVYDLSTGAVRQIPV